MFLLSGWYYYYINMIHFQFFEYLHLRNRLVFVLILQYYIPIVYYFRRNKYYWYVGIKANGKHHALFI